MVNGFEVGQKVTWSSAAGQLVGTIKSFNKAKNAAHNMIDWVTISCPTPMNPNRTAHFAATKSYFAQLKVQAI